MSSSLKSFIKAVRNSKTIASERAVIRKESAKIRTAFRDVHLDEDARKKNISKLMYLYILGEPTYFGQVECLKLLVSPKFSSKRLGYMATMLVLDENQEILTLLTNSLDNDMQNSNQFIAGLALCTLGNIASPELAQDLYTNVEKLLSSPNSYLRKKAAIVAAKLIEKNPDLSEIFLPKVSVLINEKSHGVLLGGLHLLKSIFVYDESSREVLKSLTPKVLSHLKLLTTTGYSPEYDVKGIPDPFLYVSLLQTSRLLLTGEEESGNLETLNDLLTQVCSKIEGSKSAGYAVLYEAVQTIFVVNSDSSLKVLGVNILSKLLTQRDNNARYVALNTLLNVIEYEPLAVQRHKSTIISCLQDADISIRRRALELTFAIMNQQNIRVLTKELLEFLQNSDDELKPYITTQLSIACNKYSPNFKWHFETLISLLKVVGNYFSDDVLSNILALIMQHNDLELTKQLTLELFKASQIYYNEYGLALVSAWCLGEYGELILGLSYGDSQKKKKIINEKSIVDILETFINLSRFEKSSQTNQIKVYALTAALKLSSKFKEGKTIESLRLIINSATNDYHLEIQVRAIEYSEIFFQSAAVKKGILEKMPPPPVKEREGIALLNRTSSTKFKSSGGSGRGGKQGSDTGNLLLDLLGDDIKNNEGGNENMKRENTLDLLSDIFGSSSIGGPATTSSVPAIKTSSQKTNEIIDLFGSSSQVGPAVRQKPVVEKATPMIEAFSDSNLTFGFVVKELTGNGGALLEARVNNVSSSSGIENISVLCAVTKHQKLQLSSVSKTYLNPHESATLNVKITGKQGSKIKIRVKLGYTVNGNAVNKQFDFAGIPGTL